MRIKALAIRQTLSGKSIDSAQGLTPPRAERDTTSVTPAPSLDARKPGRPDAPAYSQTQGVSSDSLLGADRRFAVHFRSYFRRFGD